MNTEKLIEEINIELNNLAFTINLIKKVQDEIGNDEPDIIKKSAITQFVSEFYHGVENIIKRLCKYYKIPIPAGGSSHIDLLNIFSFRNEEKLPIIFDEEIYPDFSAIRKFRHYIIHGYAFHIKWEIIRSNIISLEGLFNKFNENINNLLKSLKKSTI